MSFLAYILPIPFPVPLGKRRSEQVAMWALGFWMRLTHHIEKKYKIFHRLHDSSWVSDEVHGECIDPDSTQSFLILLL